MIMNKFQKRLCKLDKNQVNAVVIGGAFGNLENILEIYNTVFVIDENFPTVKAKNLVYKENFDHLNAITEASAIFFDLSRLDQFEMVKDFWQRNNSKVIIEGDEPIGREFSKPLYDTGWGCTSKQGVFHVWEKLK
jgi:Icc-related predicted phosphoesterase